MQDQIDAKGATVADFKLSTKKDQPLADADKATLTTQIVDALKEANKDAIIVDGTFTINWEGVTSGTKEINVNVKATEPTIDKSGLKEGTVKVTVNLIPAMQDQVAANDATVAEDFQLTETEEGQPLADADKEALAPKIVAALTAANPNVIIDADTFTNISWDGVIAASGKVVINVNVKATASTADQSGLKEGTAKVTVNLILVA
jgi:hypothetical protein